MEYEARRDEMAFNLDEEGSLASLGASRVYGDSSAPLHMMKM